ncbi:uncharacterized protein (TIGR02444 family) [Rhodothalassium salexigens DSM 2132]|uniref:Uncharacterized protein (TIGR02444 family) n=1 Tax=Rhodothalassium salexigens DSM 2132 TaxID=1188247 RepID=A0A4R2PIN5_RHOSA|nr:TIGR02444 family protein [Rhodothalassium salexigens]MBB4211610.1 uncharacterized protein (TIGR02444 family) [Rhodothalassium salexigens DSM 2132]MBK1639561.1 TIGR02444 family protein [Rhodothalassium salexigens DSM 2132]TCP34458.1 uncharacterized protein (TIGR02444 family) [Rhodothalassium salexigens DSM 2132]
MAEVSGPPPDSALPAPPDDPGAAAFWAFSLALYGRPGVAELCLTLQDEAGVDVNPLLLCCWLGAERGVRLGDRALADLLAATEAWRREVVIPVRTARRRARDWRDRSAGGAAAYAALKRTELILEQAEQGDLARLGAALDAAGEPRRSPPTAVEARAAARHNLGVYGRVAGLGPGFAEAMVPLARAAANVAAGDASAPGPGDASGDAPDGKPGDGSAGGDRDAGAAGD